MAVQGNSSKKISREKVLLASIPVIGSIIIAFYIHQNQDPKPIVPVKPGPVIPGLQAKAGKVNDMIVYGRYNDLEEMMSDGLKPVITRTVFNQVLDSISHNLGDFVKPIDTIYSSKNGNDSYFVKNQYQKGVNINQIIFDDNGKIYGIFTTKYPD
jgi:hypothetical protein